MTTPQQKIVDLARLFIRSLPLNVKEQTARSVGWHYHVHHDDWGDVFLSREQVEIIEVCIDDVYHLVRPRFDRARVGTLLKTALLQALDPRGAQSETKFSKRTTRALDALADALMTPPALWDVYLGVHNISHQGLPITVGRVEFVALNEVGVSGILRCQEQVALISPDSLKVKAQFREHLRKLLSDEDIRTAARVSVQANTSDAAGTLALRELRRTLNVLNFYADLIHVRETLVYLPGEAAETSQFIISCRHVEQVEEEAISFNALSINERMAGASSAMGLFDPHLKEARQRGFDHACELLKRDSPNAVEARLLTAIHWAGRAAADSAIKHEYQEHLNSEREESFLFYAVCLETLFAKRHDKGDITKRLSERCAQLLSDGTDVQNKIKKRVAQLYDLRSGIVHEGSIDISEDELSDIRLYSVASIVRLLTAPIFVEMTRDQEYQAWFDTDGSDQTDDGEERKSKA